MGGSLWPRSSICPRLRPFHSTASRASLDLPAGTLKLIVRRQGGFHLDGHTSWAAWSCERMSAPPSVCLASKEKESGYNQEQSSIFQALVRGDNFSSSAVLLPALPSLAKGMKRWVTKIWHCFSFIITVLGDEILGPL